MTERDKSPERRAVVKETRFYLVEKKGSGWSVLKHGVVPNKWVHFEVEHDKCMIDYPKAVPFQKIKSLMKKTVEPIVSAVFEYDIVAPSYLVLTVWVGMRKIMPTALEKRTICGRYTQNVSWPDEMTDSQYKESQEF